MLMNLQWLGDKLSGEYGDYLIGHKMTIVLESELSILMISWKPE